MGPRSIRTFVVWSGHGLLSESTPNRPSPVGGFPPAGDGSQLSKRGERRWLCKEHGGP